jgi:hypothetical protein
MGCIFLPNELGIKPVPKSDFMEGRGIPPRRDRARSDEPGWPPGFPECLVSAFSGRGQNIDPSFFRSKFPTGLLVPDFSRFPTRLH